MQPSKYLSRFQRLPKDAYQLIGSALLVEKIPVEERKTSSGIVLGVAPDSHRNTYASDAPVFVHVVAVGEGYYNEETGESVPLNVQPGDVALVGAVSVKWFSTMDISDYQAYELGLCREEEIKCIFKGKDAYDRAFAQLNPSTEEPVQAPGQPTGP